MNISILDSASLGADMDLSIFKKLGECSIWSQTSLSQIEERIKNCDVIVTNRVILGAEELSLAPSLKLIALTATGVNTVDLDECSSRGIGVANVNSYSTDSVAQHTFSMLLYLLEQTRYYDDYIRDEGYRKDQRFANVSRPWTEISGKTWGIIGLGGIGRKVAAIASAFGAEAVYYSTSGIERNEEYRRLSLEEICSQSDILSIHAPLNENTRMLLGSNEFSLMKNSAYLVNAGRGAIIDETALADTIKNGKLKGAALDVLTDEPPLKDNPLLSLIGEKLLITPHNAWGSIESRSRLINEVYENVKAFKAGINRNRIV
jgi:lactate dehydrogenase-like 2-hydroxyacid dehydrogenase